MDKNTQPDQNQSAADQTTQARVEELLGPPPQSEELPQPRQLVVPVVAPSPLPVEPVEAAIDEAPKERLLVIPPSDSAIQPDLPVPLAGETVMPTITDTETPAEVIKDDTTNHKVEPTTKPNSLVGKIKHRLKKWWHNPLARRITVLSALAILVIISILPASRYFILNTFGVRSSASLTVLDNSTQLPLKNVEVDLAGQTAKTDENGLAKLEHIKLGSSHLVIQKRAFANIDKAITIGWGSNPLGNYQINPTGSQYVIYAKDWLTGVTITKASASGAGADANSDKAGKILLTVDTASAQQDSIDVTVQADGYRDEIFKLDLGSKSDNTARMVIKRKDAFVSNQSGKYDVYTVDIDGKNRKLALAGSGLEQPDIVLVQHPTDNVAALVSTRVNARNSDGFLLSTLTFINLDDNTTEAVAQSEQVQIIGWIGSRLLYVQIQAGASAADPQRFKLMSYDYKTNSSKELAAANSFNDVLLDGNFIYYAPSGAFQTIASDGLIRSNADGSSKTTLLTNEVWNIFRTSYDTLKLATATDWYTYKIGDSAKPTKLAQEPSNPSNRLYITSPDGKHSLWVDQRDGKGLLIDYDTTSQKETTLDTKDGLGYPVQWLTNDVVVYRVKNDQETADYVLNINGGKPHKVTDLYNAAGIDRWYYY